MRRFPRLAASIVLVSGAAAAQPAPAPPPPHHHHHARKPAASNAETPVDHGPNTPEANGAYRGGGVVLQGAPGAPPPTPAPTPPGQTPENAVPR